MAQPQQPGYGPPPPGQPGYGPPPGQPGYGVPPGQPPMGQPGKAHPLSITLVYSIRLPITLLCGPFS